MLAGTRSSAVTALATLLAFASCNPATAPSGGQAHLAVRADVSATAVTSIVVEVTAADIATPLVFNFIVASGVASGTITIPAGSNRTITIRAYDAGGVQTHSGVATGVNVVAGANPTVSMTLTPLTSDVPIQATLGSISITIAPTSAALSLAGTNTVELTATIVGGDPAGPVIWATHDPGIASVSASTSLKSVVTGVGPGSTNIYATFQGAVGSAAITVAP